ncbi:unnamed protein product, partial [Larinioides sclopetarius]
VISVTESVSDEGESWYTSPGQTSSEDYVTECDVNQFLCNDRQTCIYKYKWCDGNRDCPNQDDEYCAQQSECQFEFFRCDDGSCIPESGRCDGYPSCPDGSDEFDCDCEEMNSDTGKIIYSVYSGTKRTSKCLRIAVPESKYLSLNIANLKFAKTSCDEATLSVTWEALKSESVTFCPGNHTSIKKLINTFSDTEVKHRTISTRRTHPWIGRSSGKSFDSFTITYVVEDLLCMKPDSFKCSSTSCVSMDKKCDGVRNCYNGKDEVGCERGVFAVPGVNISRNLGVNWLKNQRNAAWGWRENTHRAIIALYLAKGANFNGTNLDEDLMEKQLELQMSTAILRNETDLITPTQLAMYINALLAICHDPRNFYGFNLINDMKRQMEFSKNTTHLLPYLALCNAKEILTDLDVVKLVQVLESPSNHSFFTDVQSVALMGLACIGNSSKTLELKENITRATEILKKHQNEDGSFGNIYTTALVIQALLSSGHEEDTDLDLKAAIEFLKSQQSKDGSFGDFLATYLILPILNSKSLSDIGKINCTENVKRVRDSNPVADIEFKLGPKISIKYYLYVGDKKDQIHPLFLRMSTNSSVLDMMRLASEADPKYKFQSQNIKGKLYIYELFGIANDPEDEKFWLLYVQSENASLQLTTKSPDEVFLKNNDKIIMWYKTAQID